MIPQQYEAYESFIDRGPVVDPYGGLHSVPRHQYRTAGYSLVYSVFGVEAIRSSLRVVENENVLYFIEV